LYKAGSALVFGAGTVQWSWGLDGDNPSGHAPDVNMQQATVNLFADMGVQPATLQSGLVAASASSDTLAPASTITSPAPGSTLAPGNTVTITGTASDAGGGAVAGVEVSVDGGATWHPASGTTNWTYSWTPTATGAATLISRASDDSVNLEPPGAGVAVTVGQITLASLTVQPARVAGGSTATGTVKLSGVAPAGGARVALSSTNYPVGDVPPSVTIPAGADTATFGVCTSRVLFSTVVTISASYGGTTRSAKVTVLSPVPGL